MAIAAKTGCQVTLSRELDLRDYCHASKLTFPAARDEFRIYLG